MSNCLCQRAERQKHGEMLPTEMTSCFDSCIHVYKDEAYIAVACDECEKQIYIKLEYCPICGRQLKK